MEEIRPIQAQQDDTQEYLLEMNRITKEFPGVKALDSVSLRIRPATVHALMGENGAGKSTMMKCLFGIYSKDAGEILYKGKPVNFQSPKEALDNGISMVHQELNQVLDQCVMDNIWLGRFPLKGPFIDEAAMYTQTKQIFEELNISIDPKRRVDDLSVSERQMIEIAKAVSYHARIIVLDEPTSSLTEKEVGHLFRIIDNLREKGCGIVYISHKMEEILQISDDITIMRDGTWVFTGRAQDMSMDKIISLMVGRDLTQRFPPREGAPSENVLLAVKNLSAAYQPSIKNVSFDLHEGEILGVAGLMGSRRTELVETIFGIRKKQSGQLFLYGKEIKNDNAMQAIKNGFALLTEERRRTGIFATLSIRFNTMISHLKSYRGKFGLTNDKKMIEDTDWVIQRLNVKTPSQNTNIENLSGGNQQKVILGRWLLNEPHVLMLDEPTRGIDVGAKFEIYQLIIDLARRGSSVIFISSEMPELLGISDRILVMSGGMMSGIVDAATTSQEEILKLSAQYL